MKLKGGQWLDVYRKINKNLQEAELTINFTGESWFSTENLYPSYTQMYERSSAPTASCCSRATSSIPPTCVARGDDAVAFPEAWNAPAAAPQRGLRPGMQSGQRIKAQMAFGAQTRHEYVVKSQEGGGETRQLIGVSSTNRQFNPKTKQIFAALNYGRRPHGSSTCYGDCFLVQHPRLKTNALYFGGDPFVPEAKNRPDQTPYGMLGSVAAHAATPWSTPSSPVAIRARHCTTRTRGTPRTCCSKRTSSAPCASAAAWSMSACRCDTWATVIGTNADKFGRKHGARLRWVM